MSTVAIVAVLFIELCSFAGIKHRIPDVASQRFTQREKFDTKSCTLHRNELHPTESPLVCHQTLIDADITTAGVYFLDVFQQCFQIFFSFVAGCELQ